MKYFLKKYIFVKKLPSIKPFGWIARAVLISLLVVNSNHNLSGQSFYRYHRPGQMEVYAATGLTKYFGELADEKRLGDINPFLTLGFSFPIRNRWSLRSEISYYRLSAADGDLSDHDPRHGRNLSFRSDNIEISGLVVYGLHTNNQRLKLSKWRPYLFAGIGLTYFNPKAKLGSTWYSLQPLLTEGVEYGKLHLIVPMGMGLSYQIADNWKLGIEMGYRLSFTDYLDDVSTLYRDPISFNDPIASTLADRRPEIGLDQAAAGIPRGNSKTNDGYLLLGIKVFHEFSGRGPLRRKR